MKNTTIEVIHKKFGLKLLAGECGLSTEIYVEDIHRPGLELTGFFNFFPSERIHILGNQEISYLESRDKQVLNNLFHSYLKQGLPCIIITRNLPAPDELIIACNQTNTPLLQTDEKTTHFISKLYSFLQKELAKEIGIHGVCVDVDGVGILIRGESGIGKSEVALTLIERGHRLVSDDLVIIRKIGPNALIGTSDENNRHFLALRGVGLINFPRIYGSGSFQKESKLNLDILLSKWDEKKYYDAMGLTTDSVSYLDTDLEHWEIPVRPGRDIASLIEVAARNWRLKQQGYNALDEFHERLTENH